MRGLPFGCRLVAWEQGHKVLSRGDENYRQGAWYHGPRAQPLARCAEDEMTEGTGSHMTAEGMHISEVLPRYSDSVKVEPGLL